jgi:ketosteroid isomerase-like protein
MPDNVELFRRMVDSVTRGDEAAVQKLIDEEFDFEPLRTATEGTFRGHDGVRAFLQDTRENFDRFEPSYSEVHDLGDERILGLGVIRYRGRGSGAEIDVPTAVIATFRDGRMTHFKDYGDHAEALAAAGLD